MLNFTRIPAPRVTLVDPQTGIVANEWFRFFNNLYTIAYAATGSVTAGTYGSATAVPQITVDDFGGISAVTNVPIAIDASQIVSGTIASARISGAYTGITGVGTLTVGTWNASAITADYGGTGLTSYTVGDMLYYASGTALSKLSIGANTYINTSSGTAPQWTDPATITIGKATNIVGGAVNRIAYQTAADTTGFIVAPTVSNTYLEWSGTAFQWSSNPLGTVTSVSIVSANGLAGTVATATTTPAITLSTTVTGLLKGNGTAISAASSGTDYAPATSGTDILYGNGSGGFSNVTIGSGLSFVAGTLAATGGGTGTVTSVAALTLGTTGTDLSSTVANPTTTPVITLNVPTASAANRGALSAADWTIFNDKQAALVSGTNIKTVGGVSLLGAGDVGTIGLAYGGTGATSAPAANAALMGFTTTATAAGTTTLTNTSSYYQIFTGTSTQTIVLPVTSTLAQGWSFHIVNNSTGILTVNSSGGNLVSTCIPGATLMVTCILTSGTTAASWEAGYTDFSTILGNDGTVPALAQWFLAAAGGALSGATQNYFGANSAVSLDAAGTYDIECYCYFLKTTSGTVQWIPTFSSAITVGHSYLEYTPVTGFTTTVITGAMVVGEATQRTTTVLTHLATAALTTAVYHVHKLKIRATTNAACNFRLNATISAGSITPQAGSWYTARKIAINSGTFVA